MKRAALIGGLFVLGAIGYYGAKLFKHEVVQTGPSRPLG